MKRFRFRLGSVLRVRRIERDRARAALAASVARCRGLEAECARERAATAGAIDGLARALGAGLRGRDVAIAAMGADHGVREGERAALELARERARERELRGELVAAEARVRGLERLRERALEAHRAEVARAEQSALDEAAGFARRARSQEVA